MSSLGGILFLVGGLALFFAGMAVMALVQRRSQRPIHSVSRFQRTRRSLGLIFHRQALAREQRRRRARQQHPTSEPPRRSP